jgi:hypothetical protein
MNTSTRSTLCGAVFLACFNAAAANPPPAQSTEVAPPTETKEAAEKVVAPTEPKPTAKTFRYLIGGDSRDDHTKVVQWAFREAKARAVTAFIFLGDMELTPELDEHFEALLSLLDPVPFYPVLGNHEVLRFGKFPLGEATAARNYRNRFLGTARTPVKSSIESRIVYSADLPGGLHFVALDNVSQPGFGVEQMAWLLSDLEKAAQNPAIKYIVVGMHKPLARNGITDHCMAEDGLQAIADSDAAVALFQKHHVTMIVASHLHEFDEFTQGGIPSYITGGLGAPVTHNGPDRSFHHLLQLEVGDGFHVSVVRHAKPPADQGGRPDE